MILSLRLNRFVGSIFLYAVLILISIFMILPFLWMVRTSLMPPDEIFGSPPVLLSPRMNLSAYQYLFDQLHIEQIVWNTLVVSAGATALQLFFCALGGYGFAKYDFPAKKWLFSLLLATFIVPFVIMMVPLYLIMRDLHWLDTYWPLTIPWAANAFGIFFMRQYISTISNDLMDAARIDGAGEFGIFSRIILPIIVPGLTSLGLLTFIGTWNSFLWPLVILKSPEKFTLPLTISSMVGPVGRSVWAEWMGTSIISILPLLLIFIIFQRRFIEGITAGAVRG
jgi:ABC-type glycerol-3-phosphate transport system permease component